MIDLSREQAVTLAEAVDLIPGARKPHVRTIWRWAAKGLRGLRLESACIGGKRCTSKEAIARFIERLTESRNEAVMPLTERQSPRHRRTRDLEAVRARLASEHGL